MTNLTRWEPFADFRMAMDRLFDEGFSRPWRILPAQYNWTFPVELWETGDAVYLKAALPGINPEDVAISVLGETLTIKASSPAQEQADETSTYYYREIQYGDFQRTFTLPTTVDADKSDARYENGVLHLMLPKAESARPRQIAVHAGNYQGNHQLS